MNKKTNKPPRNYKKNIIKNPKKNTYNGESKKMYKEDYGLLDDLQRIRNLTESTMNGYKSTVGKYTRFHHKSFTSLIREAEKEETKGVLWKNSKLRDRLVDFRTYLIDNDYLEKTIEDYMQRVKTIYYTHEIEIHSLPYMSSKNLKKSAPINYRDLPDSILLQKIILMSRPLECAYLTFMVSSGCARKETLSLTFEDYLKATWRYHRTNNLELALDRLYNCNEPIIGDSNIYRFKTGKFYPTFNSPESNDYLLGYIYSRKDDFDLDSKLFKTNEHTFSDYFSRTNEKLNLGKAGTFNRFRSHNLRKFHASSLYNHGMSMEYVNELQGKAKNKTDSCYFMVNPEHLRREYIKHLDAVTIMGSVSDGDWGKLDLSDIEDFSKFY